MKNHSSPNVRTEEQYDNEALIVPIENLSLNSRNARTSFDEEKLEELANSIRQRGILQPLLVRELNTKGSVQRYFEVIAGNRRLLAAKRANLKSLPVRLRDADDNESRALNLTENILRDDIPFLDQAKGLYDWMNCHTPPLSYRNASIELGVSHAWVQRRIQAFLACEEDESIKAMILERPDTLKAAQEIGSIKNAALRKELAEEVRQGMSLSKLRTRIIAYRRSAEHLYGEPISFRDLRHAPINELGVVFLFGMVAQELGFMVESVRAAYPDCEAKRCVDEKKGLWKRVQIEFEFRSRNFIEHGHDLKECDVIVCWQNNWPECPLEILELKSEIKKLKH